MAESEYDNYTPQHPELIPTSLPEARQWVENAIKAGISTCNKETFLKAWWAFSWINPEFHPDDYLNFGHIPFSKKLTEEALRRVNKGEIDGDGEFYAAEAAHNAVWLKRKATTPTIPAAPTMTGYQALIKTILVKAGSDADPRHIEGFMRLEYGTLSHLPRSRFVSETKAFLTIPKEEWLSWEENAVSMGL